MRKSKEVYYDEDLNMVRQVGARDLKYHNYTRVFDPGECEQMTLVNVKWQNSGVCFVFKDSENHTYYMSDILFKEYLMKHPIDFGEVEWDIFKQGTVYSLHFKKDKKNAVSGRQEQNS